MRHTGPTAPANPQPLDTWLSTALADARFNAHPGRSYVVVDGTARATWSPPSANGQTANVNIQEANGWLYNGVIYLVVNEGGVGVLYTLSDPRGPALRRGVVIGSGNGGEAVGCIHPSLQTDGTTIYVMYIPTTGATAIKGCTATMAGVETAVAGGNVSACFGGVATLLSKAGGVLPGLTQLGNYSPFKLLDGTWRMIFEGTFTGVDSWQNAIADAATPLGSYTMRMGVLQSLQPGLAFGVSRDRPVPPTVSTQTFQMDPYRSTASCGPIVRENGQLVMLYHAGPYGSSDGGPQSDLYRAISADDGLSWTVDLWGYPISHRNDHRYQKDQKADVFPLNVNGVWWAFYTAAENPASKFIIMAEPLSPTERIWDGYGWVDVDQHGPALFQRSMIRRGRTTTASDEPLAFDIIPVDPANTTNFAWALPRGFVTSRIGVANISTGTGTILPSANGSDTALSTAGAAVINPGQIAYFECHYQTSGGACSWSRHG